MGEETKPRVMATLPAERGHGTRSAGRCSPPRGPAQAGVEAEEDTPLPPHSACHTTEDGTSSQALQSWGAAPPSPQQRDPPLSHWAGQAATGGRGTAAGSRPHGEAGTACQAWGVARGPSSAPHGVGSRGAPGP